jgi:hypothetical protein
MSEIQIAIAIGIAIDSISIAIPIAMAIIATASHHATVGSAPPTGEVWTFFHRLAQARLSRRLEPVVGDPSVSWFPSVSGSESGTGSIPTGYCGWSSRTETIGPADILDQCPVTSSFSCPNPFFYLSIPIPIPTPTPVLSLPRSGRDCPVQTPGVDIAHQLNRKAPLVGNAKRVYAQAQALSNSPRRAIISKSILISRPWVVR